MKATATLATGASRPTASAWPTTPQLTGSRLPSPAPTIPPIRASVRLVGNPRRVRPNTTTSAASTAVSSAVPPPSDSNATRRSANVVATAVPNNTGLTPTRKAKSVMATGGVTAVSYTHLRAHETDSYLFVRQRQMCIRDSYQAVGECGCHSSAEQYRADTDKEGQKRNGHRRRHSVSAGADRDQSAAVASPASNCERKRCNKKEPNFEAAHLVTVEQSEGCFGTWLLVCTMEAYTMLQSARPQGIGRSGPRGFSTSLLWRVVMVGNIRRAPVRSSPLYMWVASLLRDQIEAGHLDPHGSVPSERVLSERYDISRMTARHAVETLMLEGYVYR